MELVLVSLMWGVWVASRWSAQRPVMVRQRDSGGWNTVGHMSVWDWPDPASALHCREVVI